MFGNFSKVASDKEAKLVALDKSQGVIEFLLDGTVLTANENFLKLVGYKLVEVVGKHHSLFVEPGITNSGEYLAFWSKLRRGEFQAAQFKRVAKGGREVWIEASYNPMLDSAGKPYKIVKFATDITRQKAEDADRQGQIDAIHKSQAVIAFDLDGTILEANENFLSALGYTLADIIGRHHSLFVEPAVNQSQEYTDFWAKLRRGEYQTGQFKRIGKSGQDVWIEASYNPILDANGRPYKVVKFSTDITVQVTLLSKLKQLIERNFGDIDSAVARSNKESDEATQAAESTSHNVQTMAAAAEEVAASVDEISRSMSKARSASDQAHAQVQAASEFTQKLTTTATSMSGLVSLIQNIASQINLLALNATIESARAGDAGRGFAVVAQEVKNLANQAAHATEQITSEIDSVQMVSKQVVGSLSKIQGSVEHMLDYVISTAASVEKQSMVTRDMSANMQDAASAVAAIAQNIITISNSVTNVSQAVTATKEAANGLVC